MDIPNMSGISLIVLIEFFAHQRNSENLLRKEKTR
jgi:hypothetical protein